jgi:hypothetical protein
MYFVRLGLVKRLQIRALVGSLFLGIDSSGGIDFSGRQFRMADTDTESLYKHNNENWIGVGFLLIYLSVCAGLYKDVHVLSMAKCSSFSVMRRDYMIFATNEYHHI